MSQNAIQKNIERKIFIIRGERVMLDTDLACLYGVSTKALNQAVKRNRKRFPDNFMFRLTKKETQEVVTICDHLHHLKYSHVRPNAFTEHGAVMLASVLNTSRAIQVSLVVIKVFVHFKNEFSIYKELLMQIQRLQKKVGAHSAEINVIFKTLRTLMQVHEKAGPQKQMGFHAHLKGFAK